MKKKFVDSLFCLFDCRNRAAGSGEIEGRQISWDEAYQLVGVPIENTSGRLWKHTVAPDSVEMVSRKLEDIHWGTLLRLEFSGKQVADVEVLCDWLGDFYETEN